jgi:hypothetical protein
MVHWNGTELKFTRLTNGLVENYNRYRKAYTPRDLLPHRYITTSVKYIIGSNEKYLSELTTNFQKSKSKNRVMVVLEEDNDKDEEDYTEAKENYPRS